MTSDRGSDVREKGGRGAVASGRGSDVRDKGGGCVCVCGGGGISDVRE